MSQQAKSQASKPSQINNPQHYYLLQEINTNIRHFGYAPIDIINLSSTKINQEVTKTLWRIISDYTSCLQRQKNVQQKNAKLEMEYRKLQLNYQNLTYREQILVKEKEQILERLKFGQKQIKERYEKILKEKDEMFKEQKKFLEHKEGNLKMQVKKYQQKNRVLDTKLKKYLQKDKIQYKNNFEVMNNLNIQPSTKRTQQQIQKQYDYQVTKLIIQEKQRLQLQINFYMDILQEIYTRLQSIAHSIDTRLMHQGQKISNHRIVSLPREHSDHYIRQLRKYVEIIQGINPHQRKQQMLSLSNLPQDVEKLTSQNIKMRQYYQNWQHLYKQMKGMAKSSMSLALQRQTIKSQNIKQLHQQLNNDQSYNQALSLQERQDNNQLNKMKENKQSLKKREVQIQEFIANKIKFIKHQTLVTSRVQREMESLLGNDIMA